MFNLSIFISIQEDFFSLSSIFEELCLDEQIIFSTCLRIRAIIGTNK